MMMMIMTTIIIIIIIIIITIINSDISRSCSDTLSHSRFVVS